MSNRDKLLTFFALLLVAAFIAVVYVGISFAVDDARRQRKHNRDRCQELLHCKPPAHAYLTYVSSEGHHCVCRVYLEDQ
jgi:hypothetical protein